MTVSVPWLFAENLLLKMIESRLSASSGHQYCEPGPSIHRNTRIAIRIG